MNIKYFFVIILLCANISAFSQQKEDVKSVITTELANQAQGLLQQAPDVLADVTTEVLRNKHAASDKKYKYWGIGLGRGIAYGDVGGKIFSRFQDGFYALGLSVGAGYSSNGRNKEHDVSGTFFWTIGGQIFLENFYMDFQVGSMRRILDNTVEKNYMGLGLLLGYNWFFWKKWGTNIALGVAVPMAADDKEYRRIGEKQFKPILSIDIGFIRQF